MFYKKSETALPKTESHRKKTTKKNSTTSSGLGRKSELHEVGREYREIQILLPYPANAGTRVGTRVG